MNKIHFKKNEQHLKRIKKIYLKNMLKGEKNMLLKDRKKTS